MMMSSLLLFPLCFDWMTSCQTHHQHQSLRQHRIGINIRPRRVSRRGFIPIRNLEKKQTFGNVAAWFQGCRMQV